MKIYVAGAVEDLERVRRLQAILRRDGHVIVYDWTIAAIAEEKDKKLMAYDSEAAIRKADVVIVLPPGKTGTHVEVGMALALNRWIIVLGNRPESALYHHPMIDAVPTETELLELLYTNWLGAHP